MSTPNTPAEILIFMRRLVMLWDSLGSDNAPDPMRLRAAVGLRSAAVLASRRAHTILRRTYNGKVPADVLSEFQDTGKALHVCYDAAQRVLAAAPRSSS